MDSKLRRQRSGSRNVAEPLSALDYKIIKTTLLIMKSPVVQKDELGCGAACVAFVAECNYEDVTSYFGEQQAKSVGFYCKDLKVFLASRGMSYGYCYAKKSKLHLARREGSIVFVRRSTRFPAGHYLAYYKGWWMDPWQNFSVKSNDVCHASANFRRVLPGEIQYILYKET